MKFVKLALVFGLVAFLPACNWFASKPEQSVKLRIVNVLDKEQFDDAHIKGSDTVASINVQMADLESAASAWDKTVPVVVYCSNYFCTASGEAAKKLTELGFTDVWAYEAGMAEWYQLHKVDKTGQEYLIAGPAQQPYLEIVIPKPKKEHEDIRIISSQELQKMIKEANILDNGVNA